MAINDIINEFEIKYFKNCKNTDEVKYAAEKIISTYNRAYEMISIATDNIHYTVDKCDKIAYNIIKKDYGIDLKIQKGRINRRT